VHTCVFMKVCDVHIYNKAKTNMYLFPVALPTQICGAGFLDKHY